MARHYYGCDELNEGWERYFELCNGIELNLARFRERPKIETLNSWRVDSPKNFCFMLRAESAVEAYFDSEALNAGNAGPPDDVAAAWETTEEAADALAAKAILLRTDGSFTPGEESVEILRAFAESLAGDSSRVLLWEPSGLWTIEQTCDAAEHAGVTPVYNPFIAQREDHEFTHGDVGFALTERPGMRRQFDTFDFKQLVGWTRSYDRVFTMFRGRHKWAHARQFQTALQELGADH